MSQSFTKAMRAKGLAAYFNVNTSTIWRWQKEGRIPPGKRITQRTTFWNLDEVLKHIEGQAAGEAK